MAILWFFNRRPGGRFDQRVKLTEARLGDSEKRKGNADEEADRADAAAPQAQKLCLNLEHDERVLAGHGVRLPSNVRWRACAGELAPYFYYPVAALNRAFRSQFIHEPSATPPVPLGPVPLGGAHCYRDAVPCHVAVSCYPISIQAECPLLRS
jgi:hypothetical protein